MRTLFILLSLALAITASAQNKLGGRLVTPKPKFEMGDVSSPARDSIMKKILEASTKANFLKTFPDTIVIGGNAAPIDNMPNAITIKPAPPVYKGNNGRGFDIYESTIDGMPVLMPDSSNKASLNNGAVKKTQGVYQLPNSRIYLVPQNKNRGPKN
jgi:hypothetical protein